MTHSAFDGVLPDGWTGGTPVTKRWRGDFLHLYRVTRPCATCGAQINLDVSRKALQGFAKNAGLLLRNCPGCREQRRAGGPGSRGGTSRPTAEAVPATQAAAAPAVVTEPHWKPDDAVEHPKLLAYIQDLAREYLEMELYGAKCQVLELQQQLAKYELQPAMAAMKNLPW